MARTKTRINEKLTKQAEIDLKKLKEGKLAIKLKVIIAYQNHKAETLADVFHISVRSLFLWINTYREKGIDGLKDRPKGHYKSKLASELLKQIREWIVLGKDNKGEKTHWTVPKLKKILKEEYNITISTVAIWKHLKKMDLSVRRPRPLHYKGDEANQKRFKKNSN